MLLVASQENREELIRKAEQHEVEVTELGKLTDSGYVHLKHGEQTVALIDIEKLFNKEPRKRMKATWAAQEEHKGKGYQAHGVSSGKEEDVQEGCVQEPLAHSTTSLVQGEYSIEQSLCLVMSLPDIASKEWFFRQKDSSVKGGTIQGPLIGLKQEVEADTTIQKPLDTEGKDHGAIAYTLGIAPKLSDLDPYYAAQKSFLDMVGKIVAVGGSLPDMDSPKWDAWAVCGNYCQPNSDSNTTLTTENGEHNLASLIREGIGVREVIEKLNIPVISGKDSMKCSCVYEVDESFSLEDVPPDLRQHITLIEDEEGGITKRKIEIHDPDTYLVSGAVKIADYRKCVSSSFRQEGDLIYIIGTTKNHLGASPYLEAVGYEENGAPVNEGEVPKADLNEFIETADAVHKVIEEELVASCGYVYQGLNVTVAKAALAGDKGAEFSVDTVPTDGSCTSDDEVFYSITPGRYVITIAPEDQQEFEKALGDVPFARIGTVIAENLHVTKKDGAEEEALLANVKEAYQKTLSFGLHDLVQDKN